jgi:hypothetical protein
MELAWNSMLPGFGTTLAINQDGVRRNYEFLRDARGELIPAPIEETFTNRFVEAVQPIL